MDRLLCYTLAIGFEYLTTRSSDLGSPFLDNTRLNVGSIPLVMNLIE